LSIAADYTIKGFLYQFNKTLLELLKSSQDTEVTVEGIIEDIDLVSPSTTTAIQCKYHEASDKFTLSTIYKPLLQMMQHFQLNPTAEINYVLFAHFPNEQWTTTKNLSKAELEHALSSTSKDLTRYTLSLKGKIDLDAFRKRFHIEFGPPFDALTQDVCHWLEKSGIAESDIDTLAYPNAIQTIAGLSIRHDPQERKTTKSKLIDHLKSVKKTAISRWTLALKTRKQLLDARRKQLKPNLNKNSRLRYFLVHAGSLEDFDSDIVKFVSDYLDKYHFKPAHISTPLFCFMTTESTFRDVQFRLHQKGIASTDGYVGSHFDPVLLFRKPMTSTAANRELQREFSLRVLHWESNGGIINKVKTDDVFVLGTCDHSKVETLDVNVEVLAAHSLKEIRYMLGVSNVYE